MNKKEILDAISQEFQKSLQDIGATNGEVIKMMFPDASIYEGHGYGYVYSDVVRIPENYMMTYDINWWNAKYKGVSK